MLAAYGPWVLGALACGAAALLLVWSGRRWRSVAALKNRVVVELLPTATFDPDAAEVAWFAGQLASVPSATGGLLRRAVGTRVRLTSSDGVMHYVLEGPERAGLLLRRPGFEQVEVVEYDEGRTSSSVAKRIRLEGADPHQLVGAGGSDVGRKVSLNKGATLAADGTPAAGGRLGRPRYTARAELVLAESDHRPLAVLGLSPDPLQKIAAAMADVSCEEGEEMEVVLDLVAVPQTAVTRRRRRLMALARRRGPSAYGERIGPDSGVGYAWSVIADGLNGGKASGGTRKARLPRQTDLSDAVGKFTPGEGPVFAIQVMVRSVATHPVRARAHLNGALAALEAWTGSNRLRPVGPRWGGWRTYSNAWWLRPGFDRRWRRGDFAPPRRQWVTTGEIAALLKPPTARCAAVNVARGGGVVPPASAELPEWTGQRDVVPLGVVTGADGRKRLGGVYAADLLFGSSFGKSGFGKTEQALLQAIARAYAGDGTWFYDPHGEAIQRARPYLTHPAVVDRMWQIDLSTPSMSDRIASWNPLSMEGRRIEQVQEVIGAVVGGIVATQGWGDGAPRARTILSNAVWVLAELSHRLVADGRPDLQPTLFQVKTLLTDEAWRQEVLDRLPPRLGKFWTHTFPKYEGGAVPVVTSALDRLDTSLSLRAFFGSPRSTYNIRTAMDTGRVVWICPPGIPEVDDMVCSLLLFDLFLAGLSRRDTPVEKRLTFWAFVDELRAVDNASRGYIAAVLEQLRKYEVRLMAMTQMAMRLQEGTRQALMQNQSLLSATACDTDEARYVTARMPHVVPQTLERMRKYHYVVTAMIRGQRSLPFAVAGVPIDQVLADYFNPGGLAALDTAIDSNLERLTVGQIVGRLETLDEEILAHVASWPTRQNSTRDETDPGDIARPIRRTEA